jgi:hypothetical protein
MNVLFRAEYGNQGRNRGYSTVEWRIIEFEFAFSYAKMRTKDFGQLSRLEAISKST